MTDDTHPTEAQIREIVREELDSALEELGAAEEETLEAPTRRNVLRGAALLGGAAATLTLGQLAAVGQSAAQSGSGTIGTSENPLAAIYVDDLIQQQTSLDATGSLNLPVRSSDPSSPDVGDIWLRDDL